MNQTQNFGLNKPLPDEFYDIEKQNENMDRIDEALKKVKDKADDPSGAIPVFTQAKTRENIKSGENTGSLFGKIARFFADLKPVAFSGSYSDLSNKPKIPTVPEAVKNPHPLSINGKSYDGAAAVNTGVIGIAYGGTGAATAGAARTALGLGTASTQGIANNLTTTAAGYALDARQGKVLQDKVGEINSNLNNVRTSFQNGCSTIANKITACGVATAVNASPATMANNIQTIYNNRYNAGYNDGIPHLYFEMKNTLETTSSGYKSSNNDMMILGNVYNTLQCTLANESAKILLYDTAGNNFATISSVGTWKYSQRINKIVFIHSSPGSGSNQPRINFNVYIS